MGGGAIIICCGLNSYLTSGGALDGLGEDEEDCEVEYVQKKIFKPFASKRCKSILYPGT